jgi:hypothetical protein
VPAPRRRRRRPLTASPARPQLLLFITNIIITAVHLDTTVSVGTNTATGADITERVCYLGAGAVS